MEIELRHLRRFVAVAEEGHFGRAAERLRVSQPSLSQQIRRLEQEIGAELFDRTHQPIGLTRAGASFLLEAQRILSLTRRAVESTRGAARGEEHGQLCVGAPHWAYTGALPRIVGAFGAQVPLVNLELCERAPRDLVDGVATGSLDVTFGPPIPAAASLEVEPLLREGAVAIVPEGHEFASRSELSLAELAREPFVSIARGTTPIFTHFQETLLHNRGLTRRVVREAPDPQTQLALVAAGAGVGIHLSTITRSRHRGVVFIPLAEYVPAAQFAVMWRRGDDRPLLHKFLETARGIARSMESEQHSQVSGSREPRNRQVSAETSRDS